MFRLYTVQHIQRTMSKAKHALLPSKIEMNIQWIPVLDKIMVSSVGLLFGYNSYAYSLLRYVTSVQVLSFLFCVCFTVVIINALDSLLFYQASLFLPVVSFEYAPLFESNPTFVLLLAFLLLLLLNLFLV